MRKSSYVRGLVAIVAVGLGAARVARAGQLPNPGITASADPFSPQYVADNVFDSAAAEFATSGNAAGTPFSTDPNDGTWINFDFGDTVTFDTFIQRTRVNNVDVVGRSRLVVSDDETFDATDRIVEFNPSGQNGAGLVQRFSPQTGRYVRWEVLTSAGTSPNLGAKQMFFLNTPKGLAPLANPTAYNGFTPFNGNYAWQNAANGNAGRDGTVNEYASQGGRERTFIDFDFGSAKPIAGFDFFNREQDVIIGYDMLFSDTPDFSSAATQTLSFVASGNANQVNEELFDPITARYVRLQATSSIGSPNTGVSEIIFYTPVPEPGALGVMAVGALGMLRRRRA
jgi:MYXO-CTERM domain-containing protein